jgi:predicted metal-dependent peptidase
MESSLSGELKSRLTKARISLALEQPFLASAAMRLPFKECEALSWCTTMATDGYHIFYNPLWVRNLTDAEIEGVIAHEILHVVFGHSDRLRSRDPELWNIACDHAINLFLLTQGFSLPKGGAMDRAYAAMTSEEIYETICAVTDRAKLTAGMGIVNALSGLPSIAQVPAPPSHSQQRLMGGLGRDLVSPDDIRIRDMQDDDVLDTEQRRELRSALGAEMRHKLHGTGAGLFAGELLLAKTKFIDWDTLLRRWLYDRVKSDWRTFPFSKKHISRGFFLPSIGLDVPGHVVFAIDTSGSMSNADLATIAREVRNFRETFPSRLTVLQCDATIQSEENYDQQDPTPLPEKITIKGRGGTDFRPVFDWVSSHSDTSYPILIYATDGYGAFPKESPNFPIIWILTPQSAPDDQIPFGSKIRIQLPGTQRFGPQALVVDYS